MRWYNLFNVQREGEVDEYLRWYDTHGFEALFEYIVTRLPWALEECETTDHEQPWGTSDYTQEFVYGDEDLRAVLAVNTGLGYVSLYVECRDPDAVFDDPKDCEACKTLRTAWGLYLAERGIGMGDPMERDGPPLCDRHDPPEFHNPPEGCEA